MEPRLERFALKAAESDLGRAQPRDHSERRGGVQTVVALVARLPKSGAVIASIEYSDIMSDQSLIRRFRPTVANDCRD